MVPEKRVGNRKAQTVPALFAGCLGRAGSLLAMLALGSSVQ